MKLTRYGTPALNSAPPPAHADWLPVFTGNSWGCNPATFVLDLNMSRRDVALLGHFCAELRRHHLHLNGAFCDRKAAELLQLLNRINNHLIPAPTEQAVAHTL
ncbi:hypothetical protein ACWJJH_02675 [Endozoicomonadaceae bacterium StTr2]